MKVKYIKTNVLPPPPKYPYLGKWDGLTVLFVSKNTGLCVESLDSQFNGNFRDDWTEVLYKRVSGEVTLEF